jgi:diaminohydroxyphosphoribosylaminopyrimidine deaminase/5-amino-6-(5-phosphoribosylamino)uracil reductase
MAPIVTDADRRFMRRAVALAELGWGRVHPNPLVGAVVVRDGEIVGEGAHREFGGPHAEVEALEAAGERARGATLYVTLEPCAHTGKTPPCTTAILEKGVARLVYAVADPNPEAAGGAARLADRGLDILGGVEQGRARHQNAPFLVPLERGRPFVALKFGLSLDARIARSPGTRTAVTGPMARAEVHRLRSGFDAILVGGRTARIDDPLLTVRDAPAPRVPPLRVVAAPDAGLAPDSRLARSLEAGPVVVLAAPDAPRDRVTALESAGVEVVAVPAGAGGLDPAAALDRLGERGVRTVFCEGGGRLGAALLGADRVDRLYLFYAPTVLGDGAVPAFPGPAPFGGERIETRAMGVDTLVTIDRSE